MVIFFNDEKDKEKLFNYLILWSIWYKHERH